MKNKLLLGLLLSVLSSNAFAFNTGFTKNSKLCNIQFHKVSSIDFFSNNGTSLTNGIEGAFTVTANEARSAIYILPEQGITDNSLTYGKDYIWMVDEHEIDRFGEHITLGEIQGADMREFKVYPKMLLDMVPAGKFDASLDLKVECRTPLR